MKSDHEQIVSAFDAKTHLSKLLHDVEHGQSVTITRRGKPVARLVPIGEEGKLDTKALLEKAKAIRDSVKGPVNVVKLVHESRRYR